MALQDLTPELRTRMSRVERLVGLFVFVAALHMFAGFAYYLVRTGERRGWFVHKIPYYCYTRDSTGLKVGDPVRLLGRDIGRIVQIEPTDLDPWFLSSNFLVFVKFEVRRPYEGYILTDSRVRLVSADFFGSRYLEVTIGDPNVGLVTAIPAKGDFGDTLLLNDRAKDYPNPTNQVKLRDSKNGVWLFTDESPTVTQRAEGMVRTLADAVPALTNQLGEVLTLAAQATSNANVALVQIQPTLAHLQAVAARLETEPGAIGRMVLTTQLENQVTTTLSSMDATLTNTTALLRTSELQLQDLTRRIALTLDNVALVTSNLSVQVNANGLFLGEVSSLVAGADDMVRGLKGHWLLRSAFAGETNAPLESLILPSIDGPRP